jgi:hypothetical protein
MTPGKEKQTRSRKEREMVFQEAPENPDDEN